MDKVYKGMLSGVSALFKNIHWKKQMVKNRNVWLKLFWLDKCVTNVHAHIFLVFWDLKVPACVTCRLLQSSSNILANLVTAVCSSFKSEEVLNIFKK